MNTKFNYKIYIAARHYCGHCPICFQKITTALVYRASRDSVTMRCKKCGLKWQVTWKSLYEALGKLLGNYSKMDKEYAEIYTKMHYLKREVNINGVHRFEPRGKKGSVGKVMLKKILKNQFSRDD